MSASYVARVDARIEALVRHGASQFDEILRGALGADPLLVWQRAAILGLRPRSDRTAFVARVWAPQLHALHCEWYFTPGCAERLAARFGPALACLGAPTVAAAAGCPLVDRDAALLRHRFGARPMHVHGLDLDEASFLPLPREISTILVDPPWYPPHPQRWFHLAAHAVARGGRVAMVLPPALQRPEAEQQRDQRRRWASRAGPTALELGTVRYETPAFEQIAMTAAGVPISSDWRTADLLITTVQDPEALGPLPPAPTTPTWESFVIGEQVVTLSARARPGSAALEPVARTQNFVWDRISQRDPRISEIDLWTSRSRVATVHGRPTIHAALTALHRGATIETATDDARLRQRLRTLLDAGETPPAMAG